VPARAGHLALVRGDRHVPEGRGARRSPRTGPRRSHPRGDGQPVPRPTAVSRPPERARERGPRGRGPGGGARRGPGRPRGTDRRERTRRVRPAVNVKPKKALGQHFLADANLLGVIGRLAELAPDDVVLEIGPGLGALTRYLAPRV